MNERQWNLQFDDELRVSPDDHDLLDSADRARSPPRQYWSTNVSPNWEDLHPFILGTVESHIANPRMSSREISKKVVPQKSTPRLSFSRMLIWKRHETLERNILDGRHEI